MKKLILIAMLALSLMACGAPAVNDQPKQAPTNYKVICYSGGQKILELSTATVERSYGNYGTYSVYRSGGKIYVTLSKECIEEKQN